MQKKAPQPTWHVPRNRTNIGFARLAQEVALHLLNASGLKEHVGDCVGALACPKATTYGDSVE